MEILNPELLAWFRRKPQCEICRCFRPVVPHHVYRKGMGGGGQLDVPENLLAVCSFCHDMIHDGHVPYEFQLARLAEREGFSMDEIEAKIREYRDRPKGFEGVVFIPPLGEHRRLTEEYRIIKWRKE